MTAVNDIGWLGDHIEVGNLEDRELIRDLYARYAQATYQQDHDAWVGCFLEDGWYGTVHSGKVSGHAALHEMCVAGRQWNVDNNAAKNYMLNTNLRLSVHGNTARGQCNVMSWYVMTDGSLEIFTVGGYRDTLKKVDGKWYIESRFGYSDHPIPLKYKAKD